jgi:hypothetical protein
VRLNPTAATHELENLKWRKICSHKTGFVNDFYLSADLNLKCLTFKNKLNERGKENI